MRNPQHQLPKSFIQTLRFNQFDKFNSPDSAKLQISSLDMVFNRGIFILPLVPFTYFLQYSSIIHSVYNQLILIVDSKKFRNSRKPTRLPKSAASSAHPHIKMAMNTQICASPINNDGSSAANCTQETLTPVKRRDRGKPKPISKIPSPTGSNRAQSSTPERSTPTPITTVDSSNIHNKDTQAISTSPTSVKAMKENITDAMVTDHFRSADFESPRSLQSHTPILTANMSSPILINKKGPCTTALSISEGTPWKDPVSLTEPSLMASPIEPPSSAASHMTSSPRDIAPPAPVSSYTSYTSFTHTPPRLPPSPSPPRPLPQTSQSTPLLSNPHCPSNTTRQTHSTLPPGYYEYHTINGTTILPLTSEARASGNDSGHESSLSPVSSHEDGCRSSCGVKTSLICTYLLFACSLTWLLWMSWGTITPADLGHRGIIGSEDGPATVSSYDADLPIVASLTPRRIVDDPLEMDNVVLPPDVESSAEPNSPQCPRHPHHPHYPEYPKYAEYPGCPPPPKNDSPDPSSGNGFFEPLVVVMLHTMGIAMGVFAIIWIITILMRYDRENSI